MGYGFDDWIYWYFFTITINYYSSKSVLTAEASLYSASPSTSLFPCFFEFIAFYKIPENLIEIIVSKGSVLLFENALCREPCIHSQALVSKCLQLVTW
jgi:hypothetical protein